MTRSLRGPGAPERPGVASVACAAATTVEWIAGCGNSPLPASTIKNATEKSSVSARNNRGLGTWLGGRDAFTTQRGDAPQQRGDRCAESSITLGTMLTRRSTRRWFSPFFCATVSVALGAAYMYAAGAPSYY